MVSGFNSQLRLLNTLILSKPLFKLLFLAEAVDTGDVNTVPVAKKLLRQQRTLIQIILNGRLRRNNQDRGFKQLCSATVALSIF